jgi:hypothetical protein
MKVSQADLRDTLDELAAKLRCSSDEKPTFLAKQITKCEMSLVRNLCAVGSAYLGGESPLENQESGFFNLGNVRDVCDGTEVAAHELRIAREEAELGLETACQTANFAEEIESLARALIDAEVASLEEFSACSTRLSEELAYGLATVTRDVREELRRSLRLAGWARTKEELDSIGAESFAKIERAAGNWLRWFTSKVTQSAAFGCPRLEETAPSDALSTHMAADLSFNALVLSVRRAMALRRQQVRIASLLRRAAAVRDSADHISALAASVVC